MLTFKENFLKLKSELKADQCFNLVVIIIIGCIFMLSYLALLRPVNSEQYQRIVQLSLTGYLSKNSRYGRVDYGSIRNS